MPYPFQNNLSALPVDEQVKCLTGLADAKVSNALAAASGTKPARTHNSIPLLPQFCDR